MKNRRLINLDLVYLKIHKFSVASVPKIAQSYDVNLLLLIVLYL
jgi:hypothetical protein